MNIPGIQNALAALAAQNPAGGARAPSRSAKAICGPCSALNARTESVAPCAVTVTAAPVAGDVQVAPEIPVQGPSALIAAGSEVCRTTICGTALPDGFQARPR